MGKIRNTEQGFSAVELILVIVIVALIGSVGWFVHKDYHKVATAPAYKATTTTAASTLPTGSISSTGITGSYTYPGQYFSLKYPSSWTASATSVPVAAAQPGILSTVVTITPPSAAQGETAGITVYKSTSLSNALTYSFVGNGTTVANNKSLTINGYSAMYQQNVISGTGGSTDDSYAVTNGSYTVVFTFRVSQSSPGAGVTAFNTTSLLPEFNAIVTSVKF